MKTIHYDKQTNLTHFMDQFSIQRMEGIIEFEEQCTPTDKELVKSCQIVIQHLKAIWDIK